MSSSSLPGPSPNERSDRAAPGGGRRARRPSAGWIVALAGVLPLLPTLRAAFVYDDTTIIRDNALLRGWDALGRVWAAPYWPTNGADMSGLYRPLHVALLALVWNVGDGRARAFHLYALALYALVVVVLWRLLRRGAGGTAAMIGALWFATHPLHVEAVASVANTAELLVVLFMIALVWVLTRRVSSTTVPHGEWSVALAAAGLTAAALLAKESGLLALPLAAVTVWGWRAAGDVPRPIDRRTTARILLACAAAVTIVVIARAAVLDALVTRVSIAAPGLDALTAGQRIVAMLSLWPRIATMLVWPTELSPYYGPTTLPAQRGAMATLAGLAAAALVGLMALVARRGDRRPLVALAWVVFTYLPASNLLTATGQLVADRTLFGATTGAAMALAWVVDRVPRRAALALVVVCALAIARDALTSAHYAVAWTSHRTLWQRLVDVSPTEYRGYQLLGIDARERGDLARALPLLARAFAMEPRDRRVRFEYGQVLYATGRQRQAVQVLAPLLANADVRAEPQFVALYLDAVGRARGADAVVAEGAPLLRSEAAPTAALFVGAAHERLGRLAAADSVYGVGLRVAPRDSLLLARRAAVERRVAPR